MSITRSSLDTAKGPADWFTGDVYIDPIAAPAGTSTFAVANVHFTPGVHIAMQQNDKTGSPVTWGEHVTDEQYAAAPAITNA
jgi:hypothetical protein